MTRQPRSHVRILIIIERRLLNFFTIPTIFARLRTDGKKQRHVLSQGEQTIQEIAVELVYSRQRKMTNFLS